MYRRFRPAMQNDVLSASQIEVLTRANHLVAGNNPSDAAPLFAELGRELDVSRPRRAANLHARRSAAESPRVASGPGPLRRMRVARGRE